ncbi:MAG: Gfo/Idh/MocA family protein, partial [Cellulosilyticaceae bacterium]
MKIGIIGCGLRSRVMLKSLLECERGVEVAAITDIDVPRVKKELEQLAKNSKVPFEIENIHYYENVEEMLEVEKLDGIMIGTRCNTHTDLARQVMEKNIPLFLEKPVSINQEQLEHLYEASKTYKSEAVVSFPLRVSPMVDLAKELINKGEIGTIQQVQAVNNVPYGNVYYQSWYRDESITGGLFLQKATHDLDYINYLMEGHIPISLYATASKQFFKGDKPAGLKCKDCDEIHTCGQSPYILKHKKYEWPEEDAGCCFAVDTGNQDSGTVVIQYDTGVHTVYTQNFIARKGAAKRGTTIIGDKGTLEFDWYTNVLKVYHHDIPRVETHTFDTGQMNHFGGDKALAMNFIEVMQQVAPSKTPLKAGIESALMCIKAQQSSEEQVV